MKHRIAIWAALGFLIAGCWVLYVFATPPERLIITMREPVIQVLQVISCPLVFATRRSFPTPFWCVPLVNAATYALIGLIAELLRRQLRPSVAA